MESELILIDSSIWIVVLKKEPNLKIKKDIEKFLEKENIAINPVIIVEILQGAKSQKEFDELYSLFSSLHVINFDDDFWKECGKMAFKLRRKGLSIPITDIIIATSAIYSNSLLIHSDSHFEVISKVDNRLKTFSYKINNFFQ